MIDTNGTILSWNEGANKLKGYEYNEVIRKNVSLFYSKEDKKNGEKLKAALNDLEAAIEEKSTALATALVARDEFLMIASHELKTPLTALKLRLQMGKRNLRPDINRMPSKEELEVLFDQSLTHIDSLVELVDDLLEASRLQSGQFTLTKKEVNLSELIHSVAERFFGNAQMAIKITPDVFILADRYRMEQVVSHLLTNAVKHAPRSQIDLELNLSDDQEKVFLMVKDEGPGIKMELQEKLFQRFGRLGSYSHIGGMGLGLYMVRKIVEGHNGKIILKSKPGNGSTFIVTLPVSKNI